MEMGEKIEIVDGKFQVCELESYALLGKQKSFEILLLQTRIPGRGEPHAQSHRGVE